MTKPGTRPVSIVLPALETPELFAAHLPSLFEEVQRRGLGDEVIVVDDTGRDVIASWMGEHFPEVVVVAREANGGFAKSLLSGVERARHELVFSMNTDVLVRPGFLEPLVDCLEDAEVAGAAPRVLLDGEPERVESLTRLVLDEGMAKIVQPGLEPGGSAGAEASQEPVPVAFAVGGTFLFRREEFLARGGFDPLYEPFYWEDLDLCWQSWREGRTILYQPASVVEHHHRSTIGKLVEPDFVRAAIEKNRLLFLWKNLDDEELIQKHLDALLRWALDAWLGDQRDELVWLNLALEQAAQALQARSASAEGVKRGFRDVQDAANF